jgi:predicted amidohydrolase YtcJ
MRSAEGGDSELHLRARAAVLVLLLAASACGPDALANVTADRILHNGRIYTVDGEFRVAEALAYRLLPGGSEILAVGSDSDVLALRGPNTQVTDLGGKVVIPGLIDAHLHFSLLGIEAEFETDLRYAMSSGEIVDLITKLMERRRPPAGEWVTSMGWDEYKYERPFTRWDLDPITPDNPVRLNRVYRGAAVNTAAFRLMGIQDEDSSTWPAWWLEDPANFTLDDRIFRERRTLTVDGQQREVEIPTGMFLGNAVNLITVQPPARDFEAQVRAVDYGSREMTRLGVTGIVDPGGGGRVMRAYQEAYRRGLLHFRILQVYEGMFNTQTPEEIEQHFASLPFNNIGDRFLRWRGTKWQIDGGAGTRSSWVSDPFLHWEDIEGQPNHGYHWVEDSMREAQMRPTVDRGWEPHVHATGDLGVKQTVDVFAKLMDSVRTVNPQADLRWSVVHAYLPMEEASRSLEKMAQEGIIALVNPSFIYHQGRSFARNLGDERMSRLMPFRSYLDAGVKLAVGSDYGTSPYSPWIGLYGLMTRKDLWGDTHAPEQTLTLQESLRAMTINNAYLTYSDDWLGSLEPGKVADLVVLDLADLAELERDPELILGMADRILLTLVDGKPSFQREGFPF